MVTFRSCNVKPKVRFLVTGSFVLAMVQLWVFFFFFFFFFFPI
jgi:hypothetical protein